MLKTYTTYTTYTLNNKLLWLYEYYFQCITFNLYTWYTLKFLKRGGNCNAKIKEVEIAGFRAD